MDGLRIIRFLDVLPVSSVQNAPGITPRCLLITCDEMRVVDQVLLNGVESPRFVILGPKHLVAEVPEPLRDATITDVYVLSGSPTYTKRSLIQLGIGARIARQTGTPRLLQNFVRLLLRTTGSNVFHKTLGGGLYGSIGKVVTPRIAADVAIAVSSVKAQIIASQATQLRLLPSERLLSAEVGGVTEDADSGTVYVTVIVTAQDRQRSAATLLS